MDGSAKDVLYFIEVLACHRLYLVLQAELLQKLKVNLIGMLSTRSVIDGFALKAIEL